MYLPHATQYGKGNSTIRQNFSHTGGWEGTSGETFLNNSSITLQQCVDSIIVYDPQAYILGTAFKYTGVSMQVAGAAAEIAAGQTWYTLFQNKIKVPLGLAKTNYGSSSNPRIAGGMIATPADIIRYAQFILHNGKNASGFQIVDSVWMQEMWKDQTNKAPIIAAPYLPNPPYNNPYNQDTIRYGIGTWLDIYNPTKHYQEQISGAGAFGTIFWINRCNNTTGVIFTSSSYSSVWQTSFQVIDVVNAIFPNICYPTSVSESVSMPDEFHLSQNYPNPFNPSTIINYQIPVAGHFTLKVFDVLGREIAVLVDEQKSPGSYNSTFSIRNSEFSSGVYFYQLKSGSFIQIGRAHV
jgi:CubicO group peptidase (beta-lactamase class C family)